MDASATVPEPPALLNALLDDGLDPLFWRPRRVGYDSAWTAHMPFAHWVVGAARPRMLVELGTYNGVSYSAFCEAVARAKLATRCYAVDTWEGDEHAGHYGGEVFEDLRRFHEQHYGAFSELLRCTFDAALQYMPDGGIDLLHIDGCHGYEAVRHDFTSWREKLSDRAVVLFHDSNVRERGFGVWQFFAELRRQYPAFEFLHEHGLGVVAVGAAVPPDVAGLCGLTDPAIINTVRERFSQLGERWRVEVHLRALGQQLQARNQQQLARDDANLRARAAQRAAEARRAAAVAYQDLDRLTGELASARAAAEAGRAAVTEAARLRLEAAERRLEAERLRRDADRLRRDAATVRHGHALLRNEVAWLWQDKRRLEQECISLAGERDMEAAERRRLLDSRSWRMTAPLRRATRLVPVSLRRAASRAARLGWWTVTLRLRRRLAERAARRQQVARIAASRLFDAAWYCQRYPDVAASGTEPARHYLERGGAEGRIPGPLFDSRWYLAAYPDVAAAGANPLLHYLDAGAIEGRPIRSVAEAEAAPAEPPAAVAEPEPEPVPAEPTVDAPSAAAAPAHGQRRVVFISGEPDTPGHVYRVLRAGQAAERAGAAVAVMTETETDARRDELLAADLVVIWRCAWKPPLGAAIAAARQGVAKILFDLDDLMIAPELARRDLLDALRTEGIAEADARGHYGRVLQAMTLADFCVASTEELAWHMRRHARPALVVPNGFDAETWRASRRAARRRRRDGDDGILRIGYAAGSRTHQRDFARAADALGRILRERPECRLVLYQSHIDLRPVLDPGEFDALADAASQIEWRRTVPLSDMPREMAQFDVNLAPLEVGNPFCETKSELKYFEAALAGVCTVASPTGPFRRAIRHGETGFLAETTDQWYEAIVALLDDTALRRRMARAAYLDVLWKFGPERRDELVASVLEQALGGRAGLRAFAFDARPPAEAAPPLVPDGEILFVADQLGDAAVTVIVPSFNYAQYLEEALDSVRTQTLAALDLIVIDDCSTDTSLDVALGWVRRNAARFNRAVVLRNAANAGLGATRNAGFAAAETPYVLSLDADDRLLPTCCEALEREARASGAAFVYPVMRQFGEASGLVGGYPYVPAMLIGVPYIHANTLVSLAAWAAVGGFNTGRLGWEDYEFWCRMAERGMAGRQLAGEPLAEYRVHRDSMLLSVTEAAANKPRVMAEISRLHPWLSLVDAREMPPPPPREA